MEYLKLFIFWLFGVFLGSMGLIQILIVIFFSFSFTSKLNRLGLLSDKKTINKRDFMTIGVWSFILLVTFILLYSFASKESIIAVYIGIAFVLILGFGRLGANHNNISDYMEANHKFINYDDLSNVEPSLKNLILAHSEKATENTFNNNHE